MEEFHAYGHGQLSAGLNVNLPLLPPVEAHVNGGFPAMLCEHLLRTLQLTETGIIGGGVDMQPARETPHCILVRKYI
jgi:hypothetical protein